MFVSPFFSQHKIILPYYFNVSPLDCIPISLYITERPLLNPREMVQGLRRARGPATLMTLVNISNFYNRRKWWPTKKAFLKKQMRFTEDDACNTNKLIIGQLHDDDI